MAEILGSASEMLCTRTAVIFMRVKERGGNEMK
jgi:hypothetical protein